MRRLSARSLQDGLPIQAKPSKSSTNLGQMYTSSAKSGTFNQFFDGTQSTAPPLANDLDRVLFNPGVHFLKDPRTNVYNFSPQLESVMSIKDFDFTKVAQFVPAAKDSRLASLAQQANKKFVGSTSSMTGLLTQLHRAISHNRQPHLMRLSKFFPGVKTEFSYSHMGPSLVNLRYDSQHNVHAIASDGSKDSETLLSMLGHLMETMLVTSVEEFAKYDRKLSHNLKPEAVSNIYNYLETSDFLLRSQLDCFDPRLPGTGAFDLKTRAVCAVRHDQDFAQIRDGSDYQLLTVDGYEESYNREFYELIRTTLFKYSLQARIGSMDGIFVAYHNVRTLFGFEYLPLADIDAIFHTSHLIDETKLDSPPWVLHKHMARVGPITADKEFGLSLDVLKNVLGEITSGSQESFNLAVHCTENGVLKVLAKPMLAENLGEPQKFDPARVTGDVNDPYTMIQHFTNGSTPTNLLEFKVDLYSLVNGVVVSREDHPKIESAQDKWSVRHFVCRRQEKDAFKKMMKRVFVGSNISTPSTEHQDAEAMAEMLERLPKPSYFQSRLRQLDRQGKKYKEWDEQREKTVWKSRL